MNAKRLLCIVGSVLVGAAAACAFFGFMVAISVLFCWIADKIGETVSFVVVCVFIFSFCMIPAIMAGQWSYKKCCLFWSSRKER